MECACYFGAESYLWLHGVRVIWRTAHGVCLLLWKATFVESYLGPGMVLPLS